MPFKDKEYAKKHAKEAYYNNYQKIRASQNAYRLNNLEAERKRHRKNNIKRYGITEEDYLKMFELQRGVCAICKLPQLTKRLHIDHDHSNNKVRELLCENCNRGLGMFKDDVLKLTSAINYLKKWKDQK